MLLERQGGPMFAVAPHVRHGFQFAPRRSVQRFYYERRQTLYVRRGPYYGGTIIHSWTNKI